MVANKNKLKLDDLLAEIPDGFDITDEMRAWMDMPEVGKEVWWRNDREEVGLARKRVLKKGGD